MLDLFLAREQPQKSSWAWPWGGRLVCASRWEERLPRLELWLLALVQGPSWEKKTREGGGGTPASYIILHGCAGPEMKITSDLGKDTELVGSRQWTHWVHAVMLSDEKAPIYPCCLCLGEVNATTLFSQRTHTHSCTCARRCTHTHSCTCARAHTRPP